MSTPSGAGGNNSKRENGNRSNNNNNNNKRSYNNSNNKKTSNKTIKHPNKPVNGDAEPGPHKKKSPQDHPPAPGMHCKAGKDSMRSPARLNTGQHDKAYFSKDGGNNPPFPRVDSGNAEHEVSQQIKSLCETLKKLKALNPKEYVQQHQTVWMDAFLMCDRPPMKKHHLVLLQAYSSLPDIDCLCPEPLSVLNIFQSLLVASNTHLPSAVKLIFAVLDKLTKGSSLNKVSDMRKTLDKVQDLIDAVRDLQKKERGKEDQQEFSRQLLLLEDYLREYTKRLDEPIEPASVDLVGQTWMKPNLGWLQDPQWLMCPPLKDRYESVEDYADTMQKLWIALTFYWGAASCAPRCTHRDVNGGASACNNPLLTPSRNSEYCTNTVKVQGVARKCGNKAQASCCRRAHNAICGDCLQKVRLQMFDAPNVHSSTDFYDARVEKLMSRNDSLVLHVMQTASRKPPEGNINWSTSYRLQPTSLVAVIHLPAAKCKLQATAEIHWGELISDGKDDRLEYQRRRDGKMSVRLLSRSDCSMLPHVPTHSFAPGESVGIIDLRVFVPEVVSVLSTISDPKFLKSLRNVAFAPRIIHGGNVIAPVPSVEQPRQVLLRSAIMDSDMKKLHRLTKACKEDILREIEQLNVVQTMDRTQLHAFCNGLRYSLHCTQGPPGTGKSYTGVGLVLALQIIRQKIITETNTRVGPILALSYKNHALDEFLLDVIRNSPRMTPGTLIRLGTRSEDPVLARCAERFSNEEREAKSNLEKALSILKNGIKSMQCCMSSFASLRDVMSTILPIVSWIGAQEESSVTTKPLSSDEAFKLVERCIQATKLDHLKLVCSNLKTEAEHWKSEFAEALQEWIQGSSLPPRCTGMVRDGYRCFRESTSDSPFCIKHKCDRCQLQRLFDASCCADHVCRLSNCSRAVYLSSPFCKSHTCAHCVDSPALPNLAACAIHRCASQDCREALSLGSAHCGEHKCVLCSSPVDDLFLELRKPGTCSGHKCAEDACPNPRCWLVEARRLGLFCSQHSCQRCLQEDQDAVAPKFPCDKHSQCGACDAWAVDGELYCRTHIEEATQVLIVCSGITQKGKPCKAKRPPGDREYPWHCDAHRAQSRSANGSDLVPLVQLAAPPPLQEGGISRCQSDGCRAYHSGVIEGWQCQLHLEWTQCGMPTESTAETAVAQSALGFDMRSVVAENSQKRFLGNAAAEVQFQGVSLDFEIIVEDAAIIDARRGEEDERDDVISLNDAQAANNTDVIEIDDIIRKELYQYDLDDEEHDVPVNTSESEACDPSHVKNDLQKMLGEMLDMVAQWSWDMTPDERMASVYEVSRMAGSILRGLLHLSEDYVDDVRQCRAQASATALRAAAVIGGTVVGAAKRLPALRAAEPFAIVVEEACEVMEPTLVAVLAVESVEKLELVGDHQQLPAYVNQHWYNFETAMPKLKKSLFERMVCIDVPGGTLCSVLDVQRRMRPYVADITRVHYASIIDDARTISQLIGDRASKAERHPLDRCRPLWQDRGKSVPGLKQNLFFWDIVGNAESKPIAGLSACNEKEAKAVAELTRFLLGCGVPASCISIITPYQGQKRLLVRTLQANGSLPKLGDDAPRVTISTVDRYQGDENDIVLLSLVRARPGNRFVSLRNRFIVATSRARIGFYIVGSASAVANEPGGSKPPHANSPVHWQTFVDDLRVNSRIGSALPICCPQHSSSRNIFQPMEFPCERTWTNFCSVPCTTALPCGHACQLPCHALKPSAHNQRCAHMVNRECGNHTEPVACSKRASAKWRCELPQQFTNPACNHSTSLPCHLVCDIRRGAAEAPACSQPVPDFIHPSCNHVFSSMTCAQRRKYQQNPPLCNVPVTLRGTRCEHSVTVVCHERENPVPACKVLVTVDRPRCLHQLSQECHFVEKLRRCYPRDPPKCIPCHQGNRVVIAEGHQYGPPESEVPGFESIKRCAVPTIVTRRDCNHPLNGLCHKVFDLVSRDALPPCDTSVNVACLLCGQTTQLKCSLIKQWNQLSCSIDWAALRLSGALNYESALRYHQALLELSKLTSCKANVEFVKSCSHSAVEVCASLVSQIAQRRQLDPCIIKVPVKRQSCSHEEFVPCRDKALPVTAPCVWPVREPFKFNKCEHTIETKTCDEYQRLLASPRCEAEVTATLPPCDHVVKMLCDDMWRCVERPSFGERVKEGVVREEFVYCSPCAEAPPCNSLVQFQRVCGHSIPNVPCRQALSWAGAVAKRNLPCCIDPIEVVSPLCGHEVSIACADVESIQAWDPWGGPAPATERLQSASGLVEVWSLPLLTAPRLAGWTRTFIPRCTRKVVVRFSDCQHEAEGVCADVLAETPFVCCAPVRVDCARCSLHRSLPCAQLQNMSPLQLEQSCEGTMESRCSVCEVNSVHVACTNAVLGCNATVRTALPCGHVGVWLCSDGNNDLRRFHDHVRGVNEKCWECAVQMWRRTAELPIDSAGLRSLADQRLHEVLGDGFKRTGYASLWEFWRPEALAKRVQSIADTVVSVIMKEGRAVHVQPPEFMLPHVEGSLDGNFELVFVPLVADKQLEPSKAVGRLTPQQTVFGLGSAVSQLSSEAITKLFTATASSTVRVAVALALVLNPLRDAKPFCLTLADKTQEKRQSAVAAASRQHFMREGFDIAVPDPEEGLRQLVVWNSDSLVPVAVLDLCAQAVCLLCFEPLPAQREQGALCKNRHLCCWECFEGYVDSCGDPEAVARSQDRDGNLRCPDPNCGAVFDIAAVAVAPNRAIGEKLIALRIRRTVAAELKTEVEHMREKHEKELERYREMDNEQRRLHDMRTHVIENIFTLRCPGPKCGRPFLDFDGCCAVTCNGLGGCLAQFCAWCFACSGDDMHGHVANCASNLTRPRCVFASHEQLQEGQRIWRTRKLREYFEALPPVLCRKLLQELGKEMRDLGITQESVTRR